MNDEVSTSQGYEDNTLASLGQDDMNGLLKSTFGVDDMHFDDQENDEYIEEYFQVLTNDSTSIEDDKYKKLFKLSNKPLYEGCKSFSKLSHLLQLFHLEMYASFVH